MWTTVSAKPEGAFELIGGSFMIASQLWEVLDTCAYCAIQKQKARLIGHWSFFDHNCLDFLHLAGCWQQQPQWQNMESCTSDYFSIGRMLKKKTELDVLLKCMFSERVILISHSIIEWLVFSIRMLTDSYSKMNNIRTGVDFHLWANTLSDSCPH